MGCRKARVEIAQMRPKIASKIAIFVPANAQVRRLRPRHMDPGEPPHPGPRSVGAPHMGIGQNRREERRVPWCQVRRGMAEGIEAACLGAKLAIWAELGDVEIDFEDALLRQ